MIKTAHISKCQRWRYTLGRRWDNSKPIMAALMLNPSTADGERDDPTVSNVIKLAKREGCGGVDVYNIFAWRSSAPESLLNPSDDIVGPDNDVMLRRLSQYKLVVVGWGDWGKKFVARIKQVEHLLRHIGVVPMCLGVTASGHPLHLLMRFKGSPDKWGPLHIWRAPWN